MDSDNKKITQLTQVTSLSDSDLFIISIDVGTAPKTRAIKKSDAITGGGGTDLVGNKRLSLESGVPFSTTAQTAKTSVYWTDGTTNLSVSVPTTTNTPFDVFYSISGGTLSTVNFTNDTTRATALAYDLGRKIKSGDTDKLYLGTGRTTGTSGQCEDSESVCYIWNEYNQRAKELICLDTTDTWAYTTATVRAANNNTTNGVGRVAFVIGQAQLMEADSLAMFYNTSSGVQASIGIGLDTTSSNSCRIKTSQEAVTNLWASLWAKYREYVSVGGHYLQRVEWSQATGTTTWAGDSGSTIRQSGMTVRIMM